MITMNKYEPLFDHIHIFPRTVLSGKSGFDLEWIEFNEKYVSKLENPRQALEVISPTFMETMVDIKNEYGEIEIEYFEDTNYQVNMLVLAKPGYIFDVSKDNEVELKQDMSKLKVFIEKALELKNSI